MPSIKSLLTDIGKKDRVFTGIVQSRNDDNTYVVLFGSTTIVAKSTISDPISLGKRVVVNMTGDGWFVVGIESFQSKSIVKVVVNG